VTRRRPANVAEPNDPETEDEPVQSGSDRPDEAASQPDRIDLSGLSVAGITRRRVGFAAAGLLSIWIVVVFARQVGDATTAANRATQLAADNAALAAEVEALQIEVDEITDPNHIAIAAHGYQLGDPREVPFSLDPSVAAPADGAPGSASVRLGATTEHQTPLDSWLSLLFGPAD